MSEYEIVITQKRSVERTVKGEWGVVGQKEKARDLPLYRGSDVPDGPLLVNEMGYLPETKRIVVESRELLKQTVDTLDLAAVIRAINGL